ncbi:MAG: hypothetical protein E7673_04000 [Ruminococcaceae bacterium]|nr:hypothetical protein [Oscillospiraceae bacterium]
MNNKKRFFYNGILLTAVGIAMRTVALFFNAFVTQKIGAEGMGLYTIVMTVYGFAVTFATSGISLTVTRLVAAAKGEGREEDTRAILLGAILYALAFSLLATLVLFFGSSLIAVKILDDLRAERALKILAPSLIPLSLVSVFSGYFVGVRRVSCNAITQILGQVFKICATVWLVIRAMPMTVERAALSLSLGTTVTEILAFAVIFIEFLIDRRRSYGDKKNGADVRSVAAMAVPLGISAYIRQALLTLEHILIPKRLRARGDSLSESLSAYGTLHGMALPMILYPMVTLSSFAGLLVPEFAERSAAGNDASMRRIASRAFGITLVYATLSSAVLYMFSEELGYVIYNSSSAGKYISVLAPVIPIMYLDHVTDSVLKGIGEHVYSMWVNITDSLLSVALVWILIPKMGIMGYAVCIIAMEAYNFILSALRLFKRIKFKISLIETLLLPLLAALVSSYLVRELFIRAGKQTSPLWLLLEIVFSVCIFAGVYRILLLILDMVKNKKNAQKCN